MKVVKNNVVNMQWDAEGFIETKKLGFVSAVHCYGDVPIAFRDGKVYTHFSGDEGVISFKDLVSSIKNAVINKDSEYPYFYDDYTEIFDGQEFEEGNVALLELSEFIEDIKARLNDLSEYWEIEEVPMSE